MFDTPSDAADALRAFLPAHRVEQVVKALVPTIVLQPDPKAVSRPGMTRLGGVPDLPAGTQWPRPAAPANVEELARRGNADAADMMRRHLKAGLPYTFMGQIDLAQAASLPAAKALPSDGRLLFFYDLTVGPWETSTRNTLVIWDSSPQAALKPLAIPDDMARAAREEHEEAVRVMTESDLPAPAPGSATNYGAPGQAMTMRGLLGMPDPMSFELAGLPDLYARLHHGKTDPQTDAFEAAYEQAREALDTRDSRQQLLGSPQPEQDDPRYDLARDDETDAPLEQKARAWTLLLQVDLSDWSQSDFWEGTVYFMIRKEDLPARRFDRVVAVYQQT